MIAEKETHRIVRWLQDYVKESGARGAVLGLSGGLDSSVVAVICKKAFPNHCLCVSMPCYSLPEDAAHAEMVAKEFGIEFKTVVLDKVYDAFLEASEFAVAGENNLARANIKPRLRMTVLYYFAAVRNYLVVGTGNRSEILTGYYTKYGDGGVDVEPMGHLLKTEVREIAYYLGIPETIISKPPTAGLWPEQKSDEKELGLSYRELDAFLAGEQVEPHVRKVVEGMVRRSKHKRRMPPIPDHLENPFL